MSKNSGEFKNRYLFKPTVPKKEIKRRAIKSMAGEKYLANADKMAIEIDKNKSNNTRAVIEGLGTRY